MGAEIDRLEIQIEAQASKANGQLDRLAAKLEKLSGSLTKINSSGLVGLANSVERLTKSMQGMNGIKTTDFSRLGNNLSKLGNINVAGINSASAAMNRMAKTVSAISGNTQQLTALAEGVSALGGAKTAKAIDNLPKLATGIQGLMTTLSKAPAVSSNIIQMTNALASLTANGSKVGSAINSIAPPASNSTSALERLKSGMDTLTGSMSRTRKHSHSLAQAFGSIYANCFMLIRGVNKLSGAITQSMDYIETYNYFSVTMDKIGKEFSGAFGDYGYDSAESYADSFAGRLNQLTEKMTGFSVGSDGVLSMSSMQNLSLDPQKIMDYQASISAITNSVGLIGENSINASKALTMLAADMSSLKNVKLETVMSNLQSGLIGQSRALYKYGIDITNATLQTYAYDAGITKAVSEMSQAEKMQLRLVAILDQSKVAWGDMANTLNSVANQYRVLEQQMSNLARIIGNLFMPIVQKVLPVINGLVISLQRMFVWIGGLLGIDWSKMMDGISTGYSSDALEELGGSIDDTADGLSDAEKAAKKLKSSLMGFDELNVISSNQDTGKGSSAGNIDLSGAIADALGGYETIWDKALADSENKAQQFADNICAAFGRMWEAIEPFRAALSRLWNDGLSKLGDFAWTGLKDFYNGFLEPMGKWAFGEDGSGLSRLVDVVNELLNGIQWEAVNKNLREFWIAVEPYAEQFGEGLIDFFSEIGGVAVDVINKLFGEGGGITGITNWLNNNDPERARGWGDALGKLALGFLALKGIAGIIKGIAEFGIAIDGIKKGFLALFGEEGIFTSIGGKLGGLGKGIGTAIKGIGDFGGKIVRAFGFAADGTGTLKDGFISVFGEIGAKIAGIGTIISGVVLAVTNFIDMFQNGFDAVKEVLMVFGTALAAVGAVILGAPAAVAAVVAGIVAAVATLVIVIKDNWGAICDFFSGIGDWINTYVVEPVVGFFQGLWDKVSGFFSNLWTDISAVWGSVSSWFGENVIEPVAGFFQGLGMRIQQVFDGLWKIIRAVWQVASEWFNENVIIPVVGFFQGLWEAVSGFFANLWEDICGLWGVVSEWFNENVIIPVVGWFKGLWENVSEFFSNLWEDIKSIWSSVSTWFNEHIITPIGDAFSKVTSVIKDAFDSVWAAIKKGVGGAFNAVLSGIEAAINWVIGGINNLIGGFNAVVQWAANVLGENWGGVTLLNEVHFNRINVDKFANGGFPNTGELFLARENGISEMVGSFGGRTAVANNDQIIEGIQRGVYEAVSAALAENHDSAQVNVYLEGDAKGVFKVVRSEATEFYKRTNAVPFPI